MNVQIAALVGAVLVVARGPRGRPAAALRDPSEGRSPGPHRFRFAGVPRLGRRGPPGGPRELVVVVTEVVAQLRAGSEPGLAWSQALRRPVGAAGVPQRDDLLRITGPGRGGGRAEGRTAARARDGARDRAHAAAVVAAGRLAAELGSPLAPVLERVAVGLVAEAEAAGERSAALAGPRATARVVTGLPALGLALGVAVGADPVGVLLDAGAGTAALGLGVALVLLGRWWVAVLVRSAARAGGDG